MITKKKKTKTTEMGTMMFGVKVYTTQEAADILGISYNTLRGYRIKGRVKGQKIGDTYYFTEDDLKSFVTMKNEK